MSDHSGLEEAWQKAKLERYNLAVLGATGVGKSTLINAVFGEDFAATGIGAPVTQHVSLYKNREDTLGLYDFKGSESFEDMRLFVQNFKNIYRERVDEGEPIHGIWYCVKASDRRFDDKQKELLDELASLGIPIMLVVTQTQWKPELGFDSQDEKFLQHLKGLNLPIQTGEPIPVSALDNHFAGMEAHGLDRLIQISLESAPKGVAPALAAAQQVDLEAKRAGAKKFIGAASTLATVVGASPIPVSDALLLAPIQLALMRQIASIYGITLSKDAAIALSTQIAVSLLGKAVATGILKVVPGGFLVTAGVAGALTGALGIAWQKLCEGHYNGTLDIFDYFDSGQITELLLNTFSANLGKALPANER